MVESKAIVSRFIICLEQNSDFSRIPLFYFFSSPLDPMWGHTPTSLRIGSLVKDPFNGILNFSWARSQNRMYVCSFFWVYSSICCKYLSTGKKEFSPKNIFDTLPSWGGGAKNTYFGVTLGSRKGTLKYFRIIESLFA